MNLLTHTFFILIVSLYYCFDCKKQVAVSEYVYTSPTLISGEQDAYSIVSIEHKSFDSIDSKNFTWIINGYKITVDSLKEMKVKAYPGLDTIIYYDASRQTRDVILCDLVKGQRYKLYYNPCCSDFYFWKDKKRSAERKLVEFHLKGKRTHERLIGVVMQEAAFLKPDQTVALVGDRGRSPMFPNRYQIFVQDFQEPGQENSWIQIIDPDTKEELQPVRESEKKLIDFLYILLDDDTLRVVVDPKGKAEVSRK